MAKRVGENKKLLAIENINKTAMVEVVKVSRAINLKCNHIWVISNAYMDTAEDLKLIDIQ